MRLLGLAELIEAVGVLKHVEGVDDVELLVAALREVEEGQRRAAAILLLYLEELHELLIAHGGLPRPHEAVVEGGQEGADGVEVRELQGGHTLTLEDAVDVHLANHDLRTALRVLPDRTQENVAQRGSYGNVDAVGVVDARREDLVLRVQGQLVGALYFEALNIKQPHESLLVSDD